MGAAMTKNKSNNAISIAFAYAMAYTIMALMCDNPVVKDKFFTPFIFLVCGVWLFEYLCQKTQVNPQKADTILSMAYILSVIAGGIVGIWF
ncbi:hypothetical protein [Moraxella caviae]|uniref:hypothetical protein n=1 Tax=Moraxella caviae TaxID=34060 RepID=UPI0010565A7C|nr:hypothetical protein [Moraxella caviae]